jgi:hypothetical protein
MYTFLCALIMMLASSLSAATLHIGGATASTSTADAAAKVTTTAPTRPNDEEGLALKAEREPRDSDKQIIEGADLMNLVQGSADTGPKGRIRSWVHVLTDEEVARAQTADNMQLATLGISKPEGAMPANVELRFMGIAKAHHNTPLKADLTRRVKGTRIG